MHVSRVFAKRQTIGIARYPGTMYSFRCQALISCAIRVFRPPKPPLLLQSTFRQGIRERGIEWNRCKLNTHAHRRPNRREKLQRGRERKRDTRRRRARESNCTFVQQHRQTRKHWCGRRRSLKTAFEVSASATSSLRRCSESGSRKLTLQCLYGCLRILRVALMVV